MLFQKSFWKVLEPAMQGMRLRDFTWEGVLLDGSFDQGRCSHLILGIQSCIYSFARIAMHFIPMGCTSREVMHMVFTQPTTCFVAHSFGKKRVIAIPLPRCRGQIKRGGIKRFEKQIGSFQQREQVLAVVVLGHRITQGSR